MKTCEKCSKGFMTDTPQYLVKIGKEWWRTWQHFCSNVTCDVNIKEYVRDFHYAGN